MLAQMRQNESIGEKTHFLLRPIFSYIEKEPDNYLRYISSLFVILELIALLTPAVAMGMQWATALCPGPPMQSILELIASSYTCLSLSSDQCEFLMRAHCIMMR